MKQPKAERNSPSPYIQLGTTERMAGTERVVHSPRFGEFIGSGSEQTVYADATNPQRVLKVYDDRYLKGIDEIKNFHRTWFKRNQLPLQERMKFEGYLTDQAGYYFPVYSQNRLKLLSNADNITFAEWNRDWLPKLDEIMRRFGYKGSGTYTNGKLTVGDVQPTNIGFNQDGELRFFDADVYKKGGKLH